MDYKLLSFIKRSERRKQILKIVKNPSTPSEIADKISVSVSHVSRTLKEFTERNIAVCKTPDEKIGRIYELTKKGRSILDKVEE